MLASTPLRMLLLLFFGHALADFPGQGEFVSRGKNHRNYQGPVRPDGSPFWIMLPHCLIHAGAVFLVTQSLVLALLELVVHYAIDWLKCERVLSFEGDQLLHYGCKVLYVLIFFFSTFPH